MAVTRTGSVFTDQSSTDPDSISVTGPADADAAVVLVGAYGEGTNFFTGAALDINSVSFTIQEETNSQETGSEQVAIYTLVDPATGSQTLTWDWGNSIGEGVNICCVFYTGVDTGAGMIVDSDVELSTETDLTGLAGVVSGDMMVGVVSYYTDGDVTSVTDESQTSLWESGLYNNMGIEVAEKDGGTGFYFTPWGTPYTTVAAIVLNQSVGNGQVNAPRMRHYLQKMREY